MKTIKFKIWWMTCAGCSSWIKKGLDGKKWIISSEIMFATESAKVEYDENLTSKEDIFKVITDKWYTPIDESLYEVEFKVLWMWSPHCAWIVKKSLDTTAWIENVITDFTSWTVKVSYVAKKVNTAKIKSVVDSAWYEAIIASEWENAEDKEKKAKANEIKILKRKLLASTVFSLPILYLAMVELVSKSLIPGFISPEVYPLRYAMTQLILSIPIIIAWYKFYTAWFRNLFAGNPNMDSLIALWTGSAYLYWIYALFQISIWNISFVSNLYFETAWVIITLILLGKFLELNTKWKTGEAIKKLLELWAKTATILKDWKQVEVSVSEINLWDIIVVKPWEKVPVDWEIIEWNSSVDESMITGESIPAWKNVWDNVIWSTINKDGTFNFKATKIWSDTALAQIIDFIKNAQSSKAPIARLADIIAGYFTWVVISISILAFIIWYFIIWFSFVFSLGIFITILIIACPCALWLATPMSIIVWTGIWAKKGILIKNAEALENTHKVNVVVFDKTWTITKWKPELTKIISFSDKSEDELLILAWSLEQKSSHPLWEPIIRAIKEKNLEYKNIINTQNIPWKGITWNIEENKIYLWNSSLLKDNNIQVSNKQTKVVEDFEKKGNTVIYIALNSSLVWIIAVADKVKETSKEAIDKLKKAGIESYMITWDNKNVAYAIGAQVWLSKENIFAEILPENKATILKNIQNKWKVVAMVWDWINDAPALTIADIWIAIWAWTDVAIESADIVLMKSDILDVVEAIKLSKLTIKNIKQNLFFSFAYNFLGIPVAAWLLYSFTGVLLNPMVAALAMSMSSLTVILNVLRLKSKAK